MQKQVQHQGDDKDLPQPISHTGRTQPHYGHGRGWGRERECLKVGCIGMSREETLQKMPALIGNTIQRSDSGLIC